MRGMVRGFLIGALLPFNFFWLNCLITGSSIVWALYSVFFLTLPSALIGACVGAAWEVLGDYLGTETPETPRTLPSRSKATSKP
jgi:hypothetical protein